MTPQRWSLRAHLWAVVALVFINVIAAIAVDRITQARLYRELDSLEDGYVPLLKYGPAVQASFEQLSREVQDAVTAQDPEALAIAREQHDRALALLTHPPKVIDGRRIERLRLLFESWTRQTLRVSERLLGGESGERIVVDIEKMQASQRETRAMLQRTVFLDEAALSAAFANARTAHETAARTRLMMHGTLFALITVLILFMARRVMLAFAELRAGFARFGEADFSTPIGLEGNDELALLAASANQMANRIEELQRGLTREQANLEQVNKELESFSYSVSHDLRAPLRGIDGFSQALLEDYADKLDETGQHYLGRVRASAQRMGELIEDLLSLSRIGRASLRRSTVDVTRVVRDVAAELERGAASRCVEWDIADGISAQADERLLRVAVENLVGNAWKFTSKRACARIEFGVTSGNAQEIYFVRDNGAGFDMTYADKLFGAFQRLHSESEFEGTGIGLATVTRVVRKHGGRIWAESRPDEGATFYFTLRREEAV